MRERGALLLSFEKGLFPALPGRGEGPLFSTSSLAEKGWLAFPLSFRGGVMALFHRRGEGVGRLPPPLFSSTFILEEKGWLAFPSLSEKK